jgi:hypothetical protein
VASFKEYELGFVHVDVKHLPKLRTADGELRKRYLFVAIDRRSRLVHLAVKDDETEASAKAFLEEALAAFPFRVTHVLTDRGSCFTAGGFERARRELGIEHRKTRPYTPRTNGMVERFNGRIQREVLGITVASHCDLARLLACFNAAYNARRQCALAAAARAGRPRTAGKRQGPTPTTDYHQTLVSCPKPCWSSSAPRTFRHHTSRGQDAEAGVPAPAVAEGVDRREERPPVRHPGREERAGNELGLERGDEAPDRTLSRQSPWQSGTS